LYDGNAYNRKVGDWREDLMQRAFTRMPDTRYSTEPFWGLFKIPIEQRKYRIEAPNVAPLAATEEIPYTHIGTPTKGALLEKVLRRQPYLSGYFREFLGLDFLDGEDWAPFVIAGGSI